MITIFSNPRSFTGHFDIIQRNAIKSWLALKPACQIILLNDEQNTSIGVAREFGIECITNVACNEFGTPLLNDVFLKVKQAAKHDIIAQVNTDIIVMDDFLRTVRGVHDLLGERPFFMVGRRWDVDVAEPFNFTASNWEEVLRERICSQGSLHGMAGMDYWVFPRTFDFKPPAFVVGRPGMDSWLVFQARSHRIPVIDATDAVTIVHQNHNYPAKRSEHYELEKKRNIELAGGLSCMMTLRDADWTFDRAGLRRPALPKRLYSFLSMFYPWRLLLALKRWILAFRSG